MQVWSPSEDIKYAGVAISPGSLFYAFASLTGETENKVYLYLTA